jgi:hypothetical protein
MVGEMQRPGQSVSLAGTYAILALCLIVVGLFLSRSIAEIFWSILRDLSRVAG